MRSSRFRAVRRASTRKPQKPRSRRGSGAGRFTAFRLASFKGTFGAISSKGILEGEKADETILWLSHPGITTRSAEDTAIVLKALAESHEETTMPTPLRVGIADNFT